MVQLRDGCVLNLESESLRLEAGSAFCNSSAFGGKQRGPQRAVTNAGEIWWDLVRSPHVMCQWTQWTQWTREMCSVYTCFLPWPHRWERWPAPAQKISSTTASDWFVGLTVCFCCKFVLPSTHPGASTRTCESELCGGFAGDSMRFILSHSSLICSSTLMRLRHLLQREGDPTAVTWKGWDVLRLWRASNHTLEHTVTIHLCAIRKNTD